MSICNIQSSNIRFGVVHLMEQDIESQILRRSFSFNFDQERSMDDVFTIPTEPEAPVVTTNNCVMVHNVYGAARLQEFAAALLELGLNISYIRVIKNKSRDVHCKFINFESPADAVHFMEYVQKAGKVLPKQKIQKNDVRFATSCSEEDESIAMNIKNGSKTTQKKVRNFLWVPAN